MKILKTLALLFVLLALTVGAVAEEVYPEYTPFDVNDVIVTMPEGMAYTVTKEKGHIEITINSDDTMWDMVATQADRWGEVVVDIGTTFPTGANYVSGTTGYGYGWTSGWSYAEMKEEHYDSCYDHLTKVMAPSDASGGGQLPIATYSESMKTIVPTSYNGSTVAYVMCAYFGGVDAATEMGTDFKEAKYATIRVTYSDENARSVERNLVPAERITVASGADDVKVSDGNVFYTLEQSVNSGMTLNTVITPPDKAQSFRAAGYYNIDINNSNLPNAGAAKDQTVQMYVEGTSDFDFNCPVFYWYDGPFDDVNKQPTGNLIRVESMNIFMKLGDPKPWPNYLDSSWQQGTKLTSSDLTFTVAKKDGTEAEFAGVTYSPSIGTAIVYEIDHDELDKNDDLTQYKLFTKVKAPSSAKYYASSTLFDSVLLGDYYTSSGYMAHNRVLNLVSDYDEVPENGEILYEDNLLNLTTYAKDKGLKVYYDDNPTMFYTGAVTFIDWYDEEYNKIDRVWFVTQYETLANVVTTEIEASIPTDAVAPTLVKADAGNGFELQVASYPQTSDSQTQIHYELTLLKNGVEVPLDELSSDGVTLFIPYPSTVTDAGNLTFTVNHYDSTGNKVDSFVEGGDSSAKLERTNEGVYLTVSSLSPFVLSYVEAECKHEDSEKLDYLASGNTFTVKCACGATGTWKLELAETCIAGEDIEGKVTTDNWFIAEEPDGILKDAKGNELTEMPTEPGKYNIVLGIGGVELEFSFEVLPVPTMPATGDNSLPLALMAAAAALAMGCAFMLSRKARKA